MLIFWGGVSTPGGVKFDKDNVLAIIIAGPHPVGSFHNPQGGNTMAERSLVPAKDIEVKTTQIEVNRGVEFRSLPAPRPDLAGLRLTPLTGGPIYLVNPEGYLQWIPNPTTYNNLFIDWNGVQRVDIATMPIGPALSDGAVLAKGSGSAAVFLVSDGVKRWVTSPNAMEKYHFNWQHVYVIPQILVDSIHPGSNWA